MKKQPTSGVSSRQKIWALFRLSFIAWRNSLLRVGDRSGFRKATPPKGSAGKGIITFSIVILVLQSFYFSNRALTYCANLALDLHSQEVVVTARLIESARSVDDPTSDLEAEVRLLQIIDSQLTKINLEREELGLPNLSLEEVEAAILASNVVSIEQFKFGKGALDTDKIAYREQFLRYGSLFLLLLLLSSSFMVQTGQLALLTRKDARPDWLLALPFCGYEALFSSLLAQGLLRHITWLLAGPFTLLFLHKLEGSWIIAFAGAILLVPLWSLTLAGIELFVFYLLQAFRPRRLIRFWQIFVAILGLGALMTMMLVASTPSLLLLLIDLASTWVGKASSTILGLSHFPSAVLSGALQATGAMIGIGGSCYLLASRLRDRGEGITVNARQHTKLERGERPLRSTSRFEWMVLGRNGTVMVSVVAVPVFIFCYHFASQAGFSTGPTLQQACGLGYACAVYSSLNIGSSAVQMESQGIWILYNLPIELSAFFRRRVFTWRLYAIVVGSIALVGLIWFFNISWIKDWWLVATTFLSMFVVGKLVSALAMGQPKLEQTDDYNSTNTARTQIAFFVGASAGGLILAGQPWPLFAGLLLIWLLGEAVWERRKVNFAYLLEPTEKEPDLWGLDNGLAAILVFFLVQIFVAIALATAEIALEWTVLIAFILGGIAALFFIWRLKRRKSIPLPELSVEGSWSKLTTVGATAALALVCIGVAFLWVTFLNQMNWLPKADEVFDVTQSWIYPVLAIVAAPLLEEPIFRGFSLRLMLGRWSEKVALLVSSLLFAIVHPALSFPPVFLLGLACGLLYLRTKSIWPAIMLHASYNAVVVLAL